MNTVYQPSKPLEVGTLLMQKVGSWKKEFGGHTNIWRIVRLTNTRYVVELETRLDNVEICSSLKVHGGQGHYVKRFHNWTKAPANLLDCIVDDLDVLRAATNELRARQDTIISAKQLAARLNDELTKRCIELVGQSRNANK